MSVEELEIRKELEVDVESDLEEEIKDGIYHLALKLHRLYQHQKEKTLKQQISDNEQRKEVLSEVNISIKMEGGTTIQIKEIKKQQAAPKINIINSRLTPNIPNPSSANRIKFDWANTLRSNPANEDKKEQTKYRKIKNIASPQREWKW